MSGTFTMEAGNYVSCDQNRTNGTMSPEFYDLADTYKVVVGSLIFFVMTPLMRLNLTVFPLGNLFAVMLGALLMVLFQVVRQEEVYDVIAHQGSLTAVFLIIGILIIAQYVEREQILVGILRKLLLPSLRFENYLVRICTVVFLFAALFSNDASGTILTPIVLQVWEAQERPHNELETLILAIITSANIGAMVTVFSSLQMVLIATKTNNVLFRESRLDMRACFMYLLPVAVILWMVNTCFLVLHHRIRTRRIEKSKLVSEPSQSEQEMAGLTARESNGNVNGYLPNSGRTELATFDGVYFGPAANQHSDDRISIPCQLETIPEDDILEISSSQNTSLRDSGDIEMPSPQHARYDTNDAMEPSALGGGGSDASSSSSDDDERDRMRNTDENLHQLNISYRPGALQSQNLTTAGDSCTSLIQSLEKQSLVISQRFGIYHSLRAFSVTHFLPSSGIGDDGGGSLLSSDSVVFLVILSILMMTIVALLLVSCYYITFDLGLVPLAAAVFAVTTDAVLNRRPALALVKRADWSVMLLLCALFIWMQGFHNTHLVHFLWHEAGLRDASYGAMGVKTLAVFCVVVVLGNNLIGSVPVALIVCDLLEPCAYQRGIVLYLAVLCTAGSNLTLYSSTANMIAVQRGIQVLKYRLPFLVHFQYGFLSSLILLPFGIMLIYGLLLLGVK